MIPTYLSPHSPRFLSGKVHRKQLIPRTCALLMPGLAPTPVPMAQNIWGAENRVIWTLKCLNYSVTNPCKELATVHHHCFSKYRPGQQTDPPNLPKVCFLCYLHRLASSLILSWLAACQQVEYDQDGPWSYPPKKVANSIEDAMPLSAFPPPQLCHKHPWNGPEAVGQNSPEPIS